MGTANSGIHGVSASPADKPPIYRNNSFAELIKCFWLPWLILFIVLMILNWKVTLIILGVAIVLFYKIITRIAEMVIVIPLSRLLKVRPY